MNSYSILFFTVLTALCAGFSWNHDDSIGDVIYVCQDGTITLPWSINVEAGQNIVDIQWFFHPDGRPEKMVAMYSRGNFAPLPEYADRVEFYNNAGLVIRHATADDAGTYTSEVNGVAGSGGFVELNTSAKVEISTGASLTTPSLEASMDHGAVFDSTTHQFHAVLKCGTFSYTTANVPFDVEWHSPSGDRLNSTTYAGGKFQLLLPNPVQGGNYVCKIPLAHSCTQSQGIATVSVDHMEARLVILEAENKRMSSLNTMLVSQLDHLQQNYTSLANQLQAIIDGGIGSNVQHPSFLARLSQTTTLSHEQILHFDEVLHNQGNAYSPSTGQFTAPETGVYVFSVETLAPKSPEINPIYADAEIVVDGNVILCRIFSHTKGEKGSCTAAYKVTQGHKVWARAYGGTSDSFESPMSSFTGFWVSA